jgi:DNA (cytosine-5)-methyltransferase 1
MLKVLSLFSGIGAFEKALENLNVPYELVAFCEFDKFAVKSYCAIHGVDESKNLGDITKVDETKLPKDIDVLTYGFPCTDISNAGLKKGLFNEDGTKTRSGLFFDGLRIIKATKPKIAIAENVKNLISKKFTEQFQIVLDSLEEAGYNNYWKVLNVKDYGVPQNRERVFIVSIRKDIDHGLFQFPEPFPLKKRLKDVLEDEVDEKFYLSDKMICYKPESECAASGNGLIQVGQMYPNGGNPQAGRIYDDEGISPTMDTCSGGNRMPKILVRENTKKGYAEAVEGDSINLERINSKTRRGRVGKQVAQTLVAFCNQAVVVDEDE